MTSPILADEQGGMAAGLAASRGAGGADFVDPNLDPELALALRLSMEEERARQAAAAAASGGAGAPASSTDMAVDEQDEESRMLAEALALSMAGGDGGDGGDAMDVDGVDEEEELQRALAMSMGQGEDMSALISSLPGVDAENPEVQEALKKLSEAGKKPDQDKK